MNNYSKIVKRNNYLLDTAFYPKVSIITVVKNGQKYLEKTIQSVIRQNYKNIEYIIIDGNSLDNTSNIIKKYKDKISIYIKRNDKNLWEAMNWGIRQSNGSIVAFINSDDIFNKSAVSIAVNYLRNKKNDFVFGSVHKHILKYGFHPKVAKWSFNFYTTHSVGFFIKKKLHKQIGFYNSTFLSADLDLFLRIIFKKRYTGIATKKNEIFGYFRPGGFSSKIKYRDHLNDLNKIRINNKQNIFFVYLIYVYKIFKNFKKFFFNKH